MVLAIANFESLACRVGRAVDDFRQDTLGWGPVRERRGYDAPSDHFTRYEIDLIRDQASASLKIESVEGVSMGWGMPGWSKTMARLPESASGRAVRWMGRLGRQWPQLSDVIVVVGSPLRSSRTSA